MRQDLGGRQRRDHLRTLVADELAAYGANEAVERLFAAAALRETSARNALAWWKSRSCRHSRHRFSRAPPPPADNRAHGYGSGSRKRRPPAPRLSGFSGSSMRSKATLSAGRGRGVAIIDQGVRGRQGERAQASARPTWPAPKSRTSGRLPPPPPRVESASRVAWSTRRKLSSTRPPQHWPRCGPSGRSSRLSSVPAAIISRADIDRMEFELPAADRPVARRSRHEQSRQCRAASSLARATATRTARVAPEARASRRRGARRITARPRGE